jgi:hypothetical protein
MVAYIATTQDSSSRQQARRQKQACKVIYFNTRQILGKIYHALVLLHHCWFRSQVTQSHLRVSFSCLSREGDSCRSVCGFSIAQRHKPDWRIEQSRSALECNCGGSAVARLNIGTCVSHTEDMAIGPVYVHPKSV